MDKIGEEAYKAIQERLEKFRLENKNKKETKAPKARAAGRAKSNPQKKPRATKAGKTKPIDPYSVRFEVGEHVRRLSINTEFIDFDYRKPNKIIKTRMSEVIEGLQLIYLEGDEKTFHAATDFVLAKT